RVVPGALLEARGIGALDDDDVEADAVDQDPPDRMPGLDPLLEQAGEDAGALDVPADALEGGEVGGGRELALELGELVLGLFLLQRSVGRGDRLLPDERDRGI